MFTPARGELGPRERLRDAGGIVGPLASMTFASPQNKFKNILWVPAALSASALEGGRVISGEASASLSDSGPVIRIQGG